MRNWIKAVLSEKGEPSSKRVMGTIVILVVLGCTIGMVVERYDSVKELLEVEFISGCSLIGMSTVAGIFKKGEEG